MKIKKLLHCLVVSALFSQSVFLLGCAAQHYEGPKRPDSETFTLRVNSLTTPIVDGRPVTALISGNGYSVKLLPGSHRIDFNPTVMAYPYVAEIGTATLRFEGRAGRFYYTNAEQVSREEAVVRLFDRKTREVIATAPVKK